MTYEELEAENTELKRVIENLRDDASALCTCDLDKKHPMRADPKYHKDDCVMQTALKRQIIGRMYRSERKV